MSIVSHEFVDYPSITALRASTSPRLENDKACVGKQIFDWDSTSTATDDGVRVIAQSTLAVGRWVLVDNAPLSIIDVTASGLIPDYIDKVIIKNGATAITLTMPLNSKRLSFSRAAGSTGAITLAVQAGKTIQSLNGTAGATTTIAAHSAAGAGVQVDFWLSNNIWYR